MLLYFFIGYHILSNKTIFLYFILCIFQNTFKIGQMKSEEPYTLRFPSIILQYTTATTVLTAVATIPGPTIAAGFTLPYWLRYAITFTGINCSDEMLIIKNVHISLLAIPRLLTGLGIRPLLLPSSSFSSSSIAFKPGLCQVNDTNFLIIFELYL